MMLALAADHVEMAAESMFKYVYMGGSKGIQCANCDTRTTSLWRKGFEIGHGMHANMCNACGLKSKKPKGQRRRF